MWNKSKNKIEFISIIPEVAGVYPIKPTSKFRPVALDKAAIELSQIKKQNGYGTKRVVSTAKCTGMINYTHSGWVLTAYQDFTITTNGDGESFTWESPIDQRTLTNGTTCGEYISWHSRDQYADYVGEMPNTLKSVIKVNTPWRVRIPKGYYLQEEPLAYSNEHRFTTAVGLYDCDDGQAPLNIQLFWHVLDGVTLIKAGTPLARYILVPKEQPELEVRGATTQDLKDDRVMNLANGHSFVGNRTEKKCIFATYFGKEK